MIRDEKEKKIEPTSRNYKSTIARCTALNCGFHLVNTQMAMYASSCAHFIFVSALFVSEKHTCTHVFCSNMHIIIIDIITDFNALVKNSNGS